MYKGVTCEHHAREFRAHTLGSTSPIVLWRTWLSKLSRTDYVRLLSCTAILELSGPYGKASPVRRGVSPYSQCVVLGKPANCHFGVQSSVAAGESFLYYNIIKGPGTAGSVYVESAGPIALHQHEDVPGPLIML